ncbi:unnamed protein product [Arctogadus glacialis]
MEILDVAFRECSGSAPRRTLSTNFTMSVIRRPAVLHGMAIYINTQLCSTDAPKPSVICLPCLATLFEIY